MEQVRQDLLDYVDSDKLKRIDRLVMAFFVVLGLCFVAISVGGIWLMPGVLPNLWSELILLIIAGIGYYEAARRNAVDLRVGVTYTGYGLLVSMPLLVVGTLLWALAYVALEPVGGHDFWSFIILAGFFFGAIALAEMVGRRGAKRFWESIGGGGTTDVNQRMYRSAFYLVEHNWTDSWFFAWAFLATEALPSLLRFVSTSYLYIAAIIVGMVVMLYRGLYILRREQKRTVDRYDDEKFMKKHLEQ